MSLLYSKNKLAESLNGLYGYLTAPHCAVGLLTPQLQGTGALIKRYFFALPTTIRDLSRKVLFMVGCFEPLRWVVPCNDCENLKHPITINSHLMRGGKPLITRKITNEL
jgi:hypothetical protein